MGHIWDIYGKLTILVLLQSCAHIDLTRIFEAETRLFRDKYGNTIAADARMTEYKKTEYGKVGITWSIGKSI